MPPFIKQMIGHQAADRGFDAAIFGKRCDVMGDGVLSDGDADQLYGIVQVCRYLCLGCRQRAAQFNLPG